MRPEQPGADEDRRGFTRLELLALLTEETMGSNIDI